MSKYKKEICPECGTDYSKDMSDWGYEHMCGCQICTQCGWVNEEEREYLWEKEKLEEGEGE